MSEKKTTAAQAAASTAKAEKPEKVVYCGPTVRGVARQFTPFIGGLPQSVQDFIAKYPAAQALIVSSDRFAEVRARIASGKGAECIIIRSIERQLKEG